VSTDQITVLLGRDINDANFTASSIAEPDLTVGEAVWNAATSYAKGQEVIRVSTHTVYTNIIPGVDSTAPELAADRWYPTRPTNKWAWCDYYKNTGSNADGVMSFTTSPGTVYDVDLYGVGGAETVRLLIKEGPDGAVIFDETAGLRVFMSDDPVWEFFFSDWVTRSDFSFSDLPPTASPEVTITVGSVGASNPVSVGSIVMGVREGVGAPEFGFSVESDYYGGFEVDQYGTVSLEDGLSAKRIRGNGQLDAAQARGVFGLFDRLQGRPASFVVSQLVNYDYLRAFGRGKAKVTAAGPNHAIVEIDIQGFV
jgi:hypothetical protein